MNNSHNLYSLVDVENPLIAEKVFISHRSIDKPLAKAVAALFESMSVHYWFDSEDEDVLVATKLGMAGDQAIVHAIDRGIKHSSRVLGLLSASTRGSWWVPYEIGASRAKNKPISFLVLESIRAMEALPEYARLAANYWSIDELVRWAASLRTGHINASVAPVAEALITHLEQQHVPRYPPTASICNLSLRTLDAIDRLAKSETQEVLKLTSTGQFNWLPSNGGLIRDIAYDLFAPLASFRLNKQQPAGLEGYLLWPIYLSITQHYDLAELPPRLTYHPTYSGWRQHSHHDSASSWLQGLSIEQLGALLDRFFIVPDLNGNDRLATKEEFKAEFDMILHSSDEHERSSLGLLVNPLFGFTPRARPVYWRVLALQQQLHQIIVNQTSQSIFDNATLSGVKHFISTSYLDSAQLFTWIDGWYHE